MKPNCATEIFLWMKLLFWTYLYFFHLFSFTSVRLVASCSIHSDEQRFKRSHTHTQLYPHEVSDHLPFDDVIDVWVDESWQGGRCREKSSNIYRDMLAAPATATVMIVSSFFVFHPFRPPLLRFSFLTSARVCDIYSYAVCILNILFLLFSHALVTARSSTFFVRAYFEFNEPLAPHTFLFVRSHFFCLFYFVFISFLFFLSFFSPFHIIHHEIYFN